MKKKISLIGAGQIGGTLAHLISIKELAEMLVAEFESHPLRSHFPPFAGFREIESRQYYGKGYEDVQHRRPSIENAARCVDWKPTISTHQSVARTLDWFLRQEARRQGLIVDERIPAGA